MAFTAIIWLCIVAGCTSSLPEVNIIAPESVSAYVGEPLIIEVVIENLPPGKIDLSDALSSYYNPDSNIEVPSPPDTVTQAERICLGTISPALYF